MASLWVHVFYPFFSLTMSLSPTVGESINKRCVLRFHLALGNRTPKARFNLLMMAPFGIAFPDSYSLMTVLFSLIDEASAACVIFFANLACCKASLKSCDTVSCRCASVCSSSFAALGTCACADLFVEALNFFNVSTPAPERKAAFTSEGLLLALPLGAGFRKATGAQSCWTCKEGPLGIF